MIENDRDFKIAILHLRANFCCGLHAEISKKKNNFKLCHIDKLFWCSPNKLMCLVVTKVNKWIWIAHYNLVQLSRARNNWQHLLTDRLLMIKSSPISPNCPGVFE